MPRLCVFGCAPTGAVLHTFPNPNKFPEQFKTWVNIVGANLNNLSDHDIYKKKRVCDIHFIDRDRNRNNRLNALAVPSLYLHGKPPADTEEQNQTSSSNAPVNENLQILPRPSTLQTLDTGKPAPIDTEEQNQPSSSNAPVNEDLQSLPRPSTLHTLDTDNIAQSNTEVQTTGSSAPVNENLPDLPCPSTSKIRVKDTSSFDTAVAATAMEHSYSCQSKLLLREKVTKKTVPTLLLKKLKTTQWQVRNLRKGIKKLRERATSFKTRLANAEKLNSDKAFQRVTKNMTTPAKLFTYMQFRHTTKKPKGRRFSLKEKVLSLSIFKRSPKCYALLAKYFTLPSSKSLKRLLGEMKLDAGINNKLFEKLKKTVAELNIEDRLCTIIFDEMSITPQIQYDSSKDKLKGFTTLEHNTNKIANHALVFMVKGIKANFKQPVAYYFTNSLNKMELKSILTEVIKNVQSTGLRILCSVCDQSTVNVSAINELVNDARAKCLRIGKEWRTDYYEVQGQKIIPLYDVPHLLKGLRNNLITKDMQYIDYDDNNKVKIVKWEYIQMIYEADKSYGELRCAQKLTEEHVNPEKIKKMRVKTAAQVFSHSVAVAAEHLTARGDLPQECRNLIPITIVIDNLFDSLNSSTFYIPNGKIYKGPLKRTSPHHKLWKKALKTLKSIKFLCKKRVGNKIRLITTAVPSVNNFIKTIEGMEELWKILSQKYSFDCLLTRNFNQDPIENFFGNIRSYGGRNIAPNCVAFEGAYKALLLNNYNSPHSLQANCEQDQNQCLRTLEFFVTEKEPTISRDFTEQDVVTLNESVLYPNDENIDSGSGQRNYVCGWVLTKCLKNVIKSCQECKAPLIGSKDNLNNSFIKSKEYNIAKKWLCYPSEEICKCFHDLQNIITATLKKDVPKNNLKKTIKMFTDVFIEYPFKCNKHKESLKKYFEDTTMNVIIYSWCRSINRILAGKLTYDGVDEMKTTAQLYYNKHKNFKK